MLDDDPIGGGGGGGDDDVVAPAPASTLLPHEDCVPERRERPDCDGKERVDRRGTDDARCVMER